MKKELTVAAITFLLAAAPVFASQSSHGNNENTRGNSQNAHANQENTANVQTATTTDKHQDIDGDRDDTSSNPTAVPTTTQTITISTTPCDPSLNWKNHGAYVSCVAHLHGDVDDAARSDIGKKHNEDITPTPTISITVTPSETITPSPSISPSVSPTPTASVSPTPVTSAMDTVFGGEVPFKNLGALISRFVAFLVHLI